MAQDLRFALRMIASHRWFSLAVVATIAFGIGLNTMVFTLVNAVLFKPIAVKGGERLVIINQRNVKEKFGTGISYPDLRDYRADNHSFETLEAGTGDQGVLSEQNNPPQAFQMQRFSSGIFEM